MRSSSRRKTQSPYTTGVLDRTISNLYNESLASSIASGSSTIDPGQIFVALQNNRTNVEENIYAPFTADKETPVRGVVQFDLKHATSGIGPKDTVVQAVLFLKVKDVSPVWPGYDIDICRIDSFGGVSIGSDVTWSTIDGNTKWSNGLTPQVGVGYSISQTDDTAFDIDGYYPLYLTKQGAVKRSPTPKESRSDAERAKGMIGYHEHSFNGTVYYMPNGLSGTGKQYHGNYTRTSKRIRYNYNEYATENEAKRRSLEIGCLGFHTITRDGNTIYKPCRSDSDLRNIRVSNQTAPDISIESFASLVETSQFDGDPIPSSTNDRVNTTKDVLRINGSLVSDTVSSKEENNTVDTRSITFTSGGGRIEKTINGNEVKISKLVSRTIRPDQMLIFDITPLVESAIGDNRKYLPLLIKGSHGDKRRSESKANAQVGPQDQYVSFYSFNSSEDSTVYKGVFNTSRNEVTGTMKVDLYTSDNAGSTPDSTGAYIMRPTAGTSTRAFNDFFGTVSTGNTVTFQSGTVNINATTKVDIANTTLTVEGYNKDYIQFQNNPIAGFSAGTYTDITIKMNKTTTVNELELISSSSGDPSPPFKAFEPFTISYQGDSSGSNGSTIFTPTSIKRRDGNVVVTVRETVASEQHVDHSGGLQFANIANGPRLKIYYRTRRN